MGTRTQEKVQDRKYTYEIICLEVIIKATRVIVRETKKEKEVEWLEDQGLKREDFHL